MILAHAISGRSDLPLPVWLFAYGAGAAVAASFVAIGVLWRKPRLDRAAAGTPLPRWVQAAAPVLLVAGRAVGLALFLTVWVAAAFGNPSASANIAPTTVFVIVWVGFALISALVGDVWAVVNPFDTLAAIGQAVRRRLGRGGEEPSSDHADAAGEPWGGWLSAFLLFGFVWLELAYPNPSSPRALAVAIAVYTIVVLAVTAVRGRAWAQRGEAFAAYFGILAHMAPLFRAEDGTLRVRPPLAGLARLRPTPGTAAVVLTALGSTTFDGLSRSRFFANVTGNRAGWSRALLSTVLMVWVIGIMALAFFIAMRAAARITRRSIQELYTLFLHALVPIVFAYAMAHYFSLLVFQGQAELALASDPFGRGWNLFGTAGRRIDYLLVTTAAIAFVQAGVIVVGHVAGVMSAHDRAVAEFPGVTATRSQYPLLAVMVLYTVAGLALLLGG